jgi:mannose-6-phosphate isomerase-like protein (cupin superfamily)
MSVVDISRAEHYVWGDGCDGWHFLKSDALSVIRERVPSGRREVMHRHARAQQLFVVLDGVATMRMNGVAHRIEAGQALHVPAGVAHQLCNDSDADVHFLVISAPTTRGDREDVGEPHE